MILQRSRDRLRAKARLTMVKHMPILKYAQARLFRHLAKALGTRLIYHRSSHMNYFIYTSRHFTPHGRYELNKLASFPTCGLIAHEARSVPVCTKCPSMNCRVRYTKCPSCTQSAPSACHVKSTKCPLQVGPSCKVHKVSTPR